MNGGGRTDLALSYTYEHFEDYYFGTELQRAPTTTRSFNFFLEQGFHDSLGLLFTVPYRWIDEINRGVQDAVLTLKYRNHHRQKSWGTSTFITSVGLGFPLSRYPIDTDNPIGIRATNFQGRILTQYHFFNGIFLLLKTGLDFRIIPSPLTSLPALAKIGWSSSKWYGDAWLEYYHTFNPGTDVQIAGGTGSKWWRIGGTVYYGFTPQVGIVFNGAVFLKGTNIGKATQLTAGAVFKIDWRNRADR